MWSGQIASIAFLAANAASDIDVRTPVFADRHFHSWPSVGKGTSLCLPSVSPPWRKTRLYSGDTSESDIVSFSMPKLKTCKMYVLNERQRLCYDSQNFAVCTTRLCGHQSLDSQNSVLHVIIRCSPVIVVFQVIWLKDLAEMHVFVKFKIKT
jgi:hypothetical protein